jgi:predicted nucleotide-binding protein (sugar kinase/HSP70/actin superfamily)
VNSFAAARDRVGSVALTGRQLLVPSMHPAGAEFLAAGFRAIGVPALVMETGTGLSLGREQTSGKECFPCQITLGDALHHLQRERERHGPAFDARNYAYFLPEATGPCRFGMYNKFQRLVLDRFEEYRELPIAAITTADSYSAEGLVPAADAGRFRLMIFMTMIVADVLDRILWRARPYERSAGAADALHAAAVARMVGVIERGGLRTDFRDFDAVVADTARQARALVDPALPRRPRIGMVGEIYLRSHPFSNQELVLELERHGAEVVNATLAEWVSFITYCRIREHRQGAGREVRAGKILAAGRSARKSLGQAVEYRYLNAKRRGLYAQALRHLDIAADHDVHAVERRLDGERHFSFDIGTESTLSIGGALEYVAHGCDGIVNVYPFTCMPATIATSVLGPLLAKMRVPYLDVPCDGTHRASRETQIRTFVWQAAQRLSEGSAPPPKT